jgi:hypothetical protein
MEKSYILYVLPSTVLWYKHLITNPHPVYGQCSFTRGIGGKVVVETRRTDHHQAHPLEVPEVEWATGTSKELRPRRSEGKRVACVWIFQSDILLIWHFIWVVGCCVLFICF